MSLTKSFLLAVIVVNIVDSEVVSRKKFELYSESQTSIAHRVAFSQDNESCPVWSTSSCNCGSTLNNILICSNNSIQLQLCHCMYYDDTFNTTFDGNCLQTCRYQSSKQLYYNLTRELNDTNFNEDMCLKNPIAGNTHRRGRFCGECEEGHGLAAYSYHFISCINCTDYGIKNWIWYIFIAYVPLTVFYFVIIGFRVRITNPPMNCIVLICQIISVPSMSRVIIGPDNGITATTPKSILFAVSICGMWNLDFFRMFYTPFCLHPKLGALQTISLDFLIAVYPLLLILLTYVLLELRDRDCRLLVWMWSPFKRCFSRIQAEWDLRASLVDGFNSFLKISYMKLLSIRICEFNCSHQTV